MIRRLIARHIAKLCAELAGMEAMVEAGCYPAGTLGAERLRLAIELWQVKIAIWLALMPEAKGNA